MDSRGSSRLAIIGATLIDGTGADPLQQAAVVIEGDRIKLVGKEEETKVGDGIEVINGEGKFLLPGLIDCHVHIFFPGYVTTSIKGSHIAYATVIGVNNLRSALQSGTTTMRALSDPGHTDLAMRTAIENGMLLGPRLLVAGRGICMTGGHGAAMGVGVHEADGVDEVRKAVRQEVKAGVDWIKLLTSHRTDYPQFAQEEIHAGVEEAHRLGLKVAIHAANSVGVVMAAKAGVDTIEHGSFVNEEAADLMAEKGIGLVPTLLAKHDLANRFQNMKRELVDQKGHFMQKEDTHEASIWFTRCVEQLPETIANVRSRGIQVGMGTDFVQTDRPWNVLPEEIEMYTRYDGVSNMEAIEAATRMGAALLGKANELGTVEPGKIADLIMLERNPLNDIAALKEVSWVMKEGTVIPFSQEWVRRPIEAPQCIFQ